MSDSDEEEFFSIPDIDEAFEDTSNDEYYALLNLPKDATQEQIRSQYRKFSRLYHPDKQPDDETKEQAVQHFQRISEAYEVLSDPSKRHRYDTSGKIGLKMQVGSHLNTTEDIKKELKRRREEYEMKRIEYETNATGEVEVAVDARGLFDDSLDPVEISGVNLTQSFQLLLSPKDALIFKGNASGVGMSIVQAGIQYNRQLTSELSANFTAQVSSAQNLFGVTFSRPISHYSNASITWMMIPSIRIPAFKFNVTRMITERMTAEYYWSFPLNHAMGLKLNHAAQNGIETGYEIEVGGEENALRFSAEKNISDDISVEGTIEGTYGSEDGAEVAFSISALHKIFKGFALGMGLNFSNTGIGINVTCHRHRQRFAFPIVFADTWDTIPLAAALVIPTAAASFVKIALVDPARRHRWRQLRERYQEETKQAQEESRTAQNVMRRAAARKHDEERRNNGLVILRAIYGNLKNVDVSQFKGKEQTDKIFHPENRKEEEEETKENDIKEERWDPNCGWTDVTIPVQYFVEGSMLRMAEYSKTNAEGFFDPCPKEPKQLWIWYQLHGEEHVVTIDDDDPVQIPNK